MPDTVRHDQPGDTRPYLYDGEIHRNVQSQQQVREPLRARSETGLDVGQERREHRSELRQAIRKISKICGTVSRPASGS